ncbi:MAG: FMN-binding protein [Micrococcales bacterium]|nr:FMN-binding protein [Micrococcales bacterium]
MRRITLWLLSTLSVIVLLFSYHTSTNPAAATAIVRSVTESADSGTSSDSSSTSSSSSSTTYTGDAIVTRYGNVQVKITVVDGKITTSEVTQVPWSDHKDQEINSYAVPILNSEAVDAQSADIDMVSGATFTSEGYMQSLQSAIDQANL